MKSDLRTEYPRAYGQVLFLSLRLCFQFQVDSCDTFTSIHQGYFIYNCEHYVDVGTSVMV